MNTPNEVASKSLLFPILLLLCTLYIIVAGIRGCSIERELNNLKLAKKTYDDSLNASYSKIDSLQFLLNEWQNTVVSGKNGKTKGNNNANNANPPVLFGGDISNKGTHFEVQIGAFQFFDLHKYRKDFNKGFQEVHDTDELDKYVLAKFRLRSEAEAFKRDMIRLGIDDAWIVTKKDGKRVDINSVIKK